MTKLQELILDRMAQKLNVFNGKPLCGDVDLTMVEYNVDGHNYVILFPSKYDHRHK